MEIWQYSFAKIGDSYGFCLPQLWIWWVISSETCFKGNRGLKLYSFTMCNFLPTVIDLQLHRNSYFPFTPHENVVLHLFLLNYKTKQAGKQVYIFFSALYNDTYILLFQSIFKICPIILKLWRYSNKGLTHSKQLNCFDNFSN